MSQTSLLKRSSVSLFAVFSLALAGGSVALATPYDCGFNNCGYDFATATDVGTDTPVTGFVGEDSSEWFEFEGLDGGATLSSLLTITNTSDFGDFYVTLYNSSDQTISGDVGVRVDADDSATLTGDVPGNGDLVVEISARGPDPGFNASLTDPPSVPEPAPVTAVGLGLAAIGALRLRSRFGLRKRLSGLLPVEHLLHVDAALRQRQVGLDGQRLSIRR